MKKFKCYGCSYKNCYVEQDGDVFTPFCCVHGWDGDADWQEVTEEEPKKEIKEEVKDIVTDIPKWIIDGIFNEYRWAVDKHPKFPTDPFQAMCIIQEELGEAIQALNNLKHHGKGYTADVQIELLHTIVTCIRTLKEINLDK